MSGKNNEDAVLKSSFNEENCNKSTVSQKNAAMRLLLTLRKRHLAVLMPNIFCRFEQRVGTALV